MTMSRQDIIDMAAKAGFEIGSATNQIYAPEPCTVELHRFATLVAAMEREECAMICDEAGNASKAGYAGEGCNRVASTIRARSEAKP